MYSETFFLIAGIGVLTLLTEVWLSEKWWVPKTSEWFTYSIWQGILSLLFFVTLMQWMYCAFIKPPVFRKSNAVRFGQELYKYISRGIDDELKIIARELSLSTRKLIEYSRCLKPNAESQENFKNKYVVKDWAQEIFRVRLGSLLPLISSGRRSAKSI